MPPTTAPRPVARLTDAHWARIQPLLPAPAAVGRPPADARTVLAGVLRVLHRHASWRALPVDFGPWPTVDSRYRQWRLTGLWPRLLQVLHDTASTTLEVSLSY
jgi:transposase